MRTGRFAAIAPLSSISLGIRPNPKSLRDFLAHRFKRIEVLGVTPRSKQESLNGYPRYALRPLGMVVKSAASMLISSMANSEVDAISSLGKDCGFHLDIAQERDRNFAHIWVARLDSRSTSPDAFLLAWQAADELDIIAVGTAENARRLGLAKALVAELLQFARQQALRTILLEVRKSNLAAMALYQYFGFQTGRIREAYYSEPTEDGIEMSLKFDAHGCIESTCSGDRFSEA